MFDERNQRNDGLMRGVYRFTGRARSEESTILWSIILKIQGDRAQSERNAYRSGVLDALPAGFGIPICYADREWPNGDYWLWLEDVRDEVGEVWPVERFGTAARHLGHFNGAYLTGRPLPTEPWMGRKPSARWDETAEIIGRLGSMQKHPLIARAYTPENSEGIRRLWNERMIFLAALNELPKTLCHLDAQRSNLVARTKDGIDQTVGIDWGRPGIGCLGIEIAQFAVNFRSVRDVDFDQLQALNDLVFEQYLAGLRDVGWEGDAKILRLGYTASAALQNGLSDILSLRGGVYPKGYDRMRLLWGERSEEENMERGGELLSFILRMGDEARVLMNEMG